MKIVEAGDFEIYNIKRSTIPIVLNCNAFGSGEHETTRSCLEIISKLDFSNKTILDIGAGTGILSFASLKKGAKQAICFDISFEACKNLKENAHYNCLNNIYSVCSTIDAINSQYDVIFANIYSSIILSNVNNIDKLLKEEGLLIASGINYEYNFETRHEFEKLGYETQEVKFLEDYVTMVLKKCKTKI
ncbi:Ribosomal protein L11 methyltransferase [Desulfurella amilsii]|uniref:Ribosomal protein L11 methyltransferase n=1 Tax=Desulfurella amilsii TaxID=1562698 RepID=A0A1X4XYV3_9BACT|nr:50S ribosomal protein L11 methyltransferase [Desulfurella amilsii]OSS42719.1 Ribosomal protein L11 methyltransferase [Desulfurella amilsii]OSS42795.1 Ribosomal protein L11 methyltransferase [Desulfurella amilsii]